MLKKILTNELEVGMYVIDSNLPWTEHPLLYSVEGEVSSQTQIDKIQREGWREVFIDTQKGEWGRARGENKSAEEQISTAVANKKHVKEKAKPAKPPVKEKIPLDEELVKARAVYADTLKFAKDFMQEAQTGGNIDFDASETLVENIIDSVVRNNDAMVSLTKLRQFDEYTFTHCINVAVLSVSYGSYLGLGKSAMHELGMAALFHDIGKALIPKNILNKPGKLSDREFEIMKQHPFEGYALLKKQTGLHDDVLVGVVEHHEKHNGAGYPSGLDGDTISRFGRIISVVDVYDALTSERVYKQGIMPNKALSIMYGMRDSEFFSVDIEKFIKCLGIFPVGNIVRLNNGDYAVVIESNPKSPLYPKVKIVLDRKLRQKLPRTVDLARYDASEERLPKGETRLKILDCLDHKLYNLDPSMYLS